MGTRNESSRQVWQRRVVRVLGPVLAVEVVGMAIGAGALSAALVLGSWLVFVLVAALTVPMPLGAPPWRVVGWTPHVAAFAPGVASFPVSFWLTSHAEELSWPTLTATLAGFAAVVAVVIAIVGLRRRRARARPGELVALRSRRPSPQPPNTGSMDAV